MATEYHVLSLGAGVQSSVMLLLACRGVLPRPDAAIFADTQDELPETYAHLEWLREQCAAAGIPLVTVTAGNLAADALAFSRKQTSENGRFASLPMYVDNGPEAERRDGRRNRQCTSEYKIAPIQQWVRRELIGLKPRQRMPRDVRVYSWRGITLDEVRRAKDSTTPWEVATYPFLGMPVEACGDWLDRPWRRNDCVRWFAENYPDRHLPRSACAICPNRSNVEWRHLRDQYPERWAAACQFDALQRAAEVARPANAANKMRGATYLHRSLVPLAVAPIDDSTDQPSLGLCDGGHCFT